MGNPGIREQQIQKLENNLETYRRGIDKLRNEKLYWY
jgi:hypothetical protein